MGIVGSLFDPADLLAAVPENIYPGKPLIRLSSIDAISNDSTDI